MWGLQNATLQFHKISAKLYEGIADHGRLQAITGTFLGNWPHLKKNCGKY